MPPAAPLVSVIVPSYNHARFLAATLDSILGQSHRPLEVIVVDGGSTDGTAAILADYAARHAELRWLSEKDEGPANAVNKGLALARGEIAAIQNSDDLYLPGAIEAAVQALRANAHCGLVYGDLECIDEQGRALGGATVPEFSWEAFFGIALNIPQSSIFFRTALAREVGGWDGRYYSCDLEFWLKLLFRTGAIRIPRPLSAWRIYEGQRTSPSRYGRIYRDYWRMIADSPDVRAAPWHVRRLALASRHILAFKMHPTGNRWAIRAHALAALCLHPGFWRQDSRHWLIHALPELQWLRRMRRAWHGGAAPPARPGDRVAAIVAEFSRNHPRAFFVQVGSNDATQLDPLRQAILSTQWSGILIEPVPYVFRRLQERYGHLPRLKLENVAIADTDGVRDFHFLREAADPSRLPRWYDALGSFRREVILSHARDIPDIEQRLACEPLPCLTFDTLCRRNGVGRIDLIHIDTEGYDYEVIKRIDFDRYRPRVLVYENKHLAAAERAACAARLRALGYELLDDGPDTIALDATRWRSNGRSLQRAWRRLAGTSA